MAKCFVACSNHSRLNLGRASHLLGTLISIQCSEMMESLNSALANDRTLLNETELEHVAKSPPCCVCVFIIMHMQHLYHYTYNIQTHKFSYSRCQISLCSMFLYTILRAVVRRRMEIRLSVCPVCRNLGIGRNGRIGDIPGVQSGRKCRSN
jgi:hypothetical protein